MRTSKAPRRTRQNAKTPQVGANPIPNCTAPHAITQKVRRFRAPTFLRATLLGSSLQMNEANQRDRREDKINIQENVRHEIDARDDAVPRANTQLLRGKSQITSKKLA